MVDLKSLVENESIADVACSLAGIGGDHVLSYIYLDHLYTRYKQTVHQTPEFRKAIRQLIEQQKLVMSAQMGLSRGINWEMPQCRKDKKYGFE